MKKFTAVAAGGIGYVLGARAGRQRYEQIRSIAQRVKSNPKVQQTAHQAADLAKDVAPAVKDKVAGAADTAARKTKSSDPSNGVPMDESAYPKS